VRIILGQIWHREIISFLHVMKVPGRPRRRWEDNMRMDLTERRWEGVDWMRLRIGASSTLL
jgi:hypothetical protein